MLVKVHSHPLKYLGKNYKTNCVCDGKELDEKCRSGELDYYFGFERFRCDKCDFDLCKYCMEYYFMKNDEGCIIF